MHALILKLSQSILRVPLSNPSQRSRLRSRFLKLSRHLTRKAETHAAAVVIVLLNAVDVVVDPEEVVDVVETEVEDLNVVARALEQSMLKMSRLSPL